MILLKLKMHILQCILEKLSNFSMFLLPGTYLQISFKDLCFYNLKKHALNNKLTFNVVQKFSLIQNIPGVYYNISILSF